MQKICPHCGAFMPTEAVFCLHCFSAVDISETTASPRGGATPRKKPAVRRVQHRIGERCTAGILLVTLLTSMFFSFAGGHFSPASALHTFTHGDGLFTATHRSEQTETSETEPDSLAAKETASVFQTLGQTAGGLSTPQNPLSHLFPTAPLDTLPTENTDNGGKTPDSGLPPEAPTDTSPVLPSENPTEPTDENSTDEVPLPPENNPALFTYVAEGSRIAITGYTGSAMHVVVPAVIDGQIVCRISGGTFQSLSTVQKITLETDARQTYLWVDNGCVQNCPNLRAFHFNSTDLGIKGAFATDCPKLETVTLPTDVRQYRVTGGGLYYYSGKEWRLRFYIPACKDTELTIPSWCVGVETVCNLQDNPYLKVLRLHRSCISFPTQNMVNPALEAIYVEDGNPYAISKDGVLYHTHSGDTYTTSCYPLSKKDAVYKMPENVRMQAGGNKGGNTSLEELWIPKTSSFNVSFSFFPNLKRIYLESGHPQEAYIRSAFLGEIYTY